MRPNWRQWASPRCGYPRRVRRGLPIYLDVVLNHKAGADATEAVMATPVSQDNRNIEIGPPREITAWWVEQ